MNYRLPAEWEPQAGILVAWPHSATDWAEILDEAKAVYLDIIKAITRFQLCIIAAPDPNIVQQYLDTAGLNCDRVRLYTITTNDTWARDFGPITVFDRQSPVLLNFSFNGWGEKFPSQDDNKATYFLHAAGAFGEVELKTIDLVLEGGSVESDGDGTILTTAECLLNPNRNPLYKRAEIEKTLRVLLGAERILWLENGYLAGDDTDSHIDTLARLCPNETIVYQSCDDKNDEHYLALSAMQIELRGFRTKTNTPFRLLPLPWPQAKYEDDQRLPATYANFLIINGAVLVPTYNDPSDQAALDVIAQAFPEREIIGIECSTLIRQHGSLHCVTIQLPEGVIL